MKKIFVTDIEIQKVRHLKNIIIPLSKEKTKHLILTGKNGSGKTSVLDALADYFQINVVKAAAKKQDLYSQNYEEILSGDDIRKRLLLYEEAVSKIYGEKKKKELEISLSEEQPSLLEEFEKGRFILAYYKAERNFIAELPKHAEKVELKNYYRMDEEPRQLFVKYLLDLKVTEALSITKGKKKKADEINQWFLRLQDLLRKIFEDETLELIFEEDTFSFQIKESGREPFSFNTLSSGFSAVLDIVLDIIIRMENVTKRSFDFSVPGIVLIDEIETHLHIELQKTILELLTTIFPNIQFIVSTHSPFVLSCLDDVVIYDLENNILVENGLANIPYGGIVEGYFGANTMSDSLKRKYERYKYLTRKKVLTDDDFEEIAKLELFLEEIPDYLALNITTEYQRLKMEFENREDI